MTVEQLDFEKFPKIPRLNRDIIITEKIDGTNAQIFITHEPITRSMAVHPGKTYEIDGPVIRERTSQVWAGSRKRWLLPECDNFGFAAWVEEHADELLRLGPGRHFGEWWGQGINRGYELDERRFSLFNVSRWQSPRLMIEHPAPLEKRCLAPRCCHVVPILWAGPFDTELIRGVLARLQEIGSAAAPTFMNPEGIVVYHTQGNCCFKVTIKNDDKPKGKTDGS